MSSSFRVILFATDKNHTFGLSTLAQFVKIIGGAEGDRTPDLMTASHALSQLSYGPMCGKY